MSRTLLKLAVALGVIGLLSWLSRLPAWVTGLWVLLAVAALTIEYRTGKGDSLADEEKN